MGDGETGFDDGSTAVRNTRDPGQPTESERRVHMNTHSTLKIMVQVLCDGTLCEFAAQEIGCSRRFGMGAPRVDGLWIPRRDRI